MDCYEEWQKKNCRMRSEDTSSNIWRHRRLEKIISGELELFLGQGHVTIGNEAGYVGHTTFPNNTHTSSWLLRQAADRENSTE